MMTALDNQGDGPSTLGGTLAATLNATLGLNLKKILFFYLN
jgi:hypothetical protein